MKEVKYVLWKEGEERRRREKETREENEKGENKGSLRGWKNEEEGQETKTRYFQKLSYLILRKT